MGGLFLLPTAVIILDSAIGVNYSNYIYISTEVCIRMVSLGSFPIKWAFGPMVGRMWLFHITDEHIDTRTPCINANGLLFIIHLLIDRVDYNRLFASHCLWCSSGVQPNYSVWGLSPSSTTGKMTKSFLRQLFFCRNRMCGLTAKKLIFKIHRNEKLNKTNNQHVEKRSTQKEKRMPYLIKHGGSVQNYKWKL